MWGPRESHEARIRTNPDESNSEDRGRGQYMSGGSGSQGSAGEVSSDFPRDIGMATRESIMASFCTHTRTHARMHARGLLPLHRRASDRRVRPGTRGHVTTVLRKHANSATTGGERAPTKAHQRAIADIAHDVADARACFARVCLASAAKASTGHGRTASGGAGAPTSGASKRRKTSSVSYARPPAGGTGSPCTAEATRKPNKSVHPRAATASPNIVSG